MCGDALRVVGLMQFSVQGVRRPALYGRARQYSAQALLLPKQQWQCGCWQRRGPSRGSLTDLQAGRNLFDSDTAAVSAPRDSSRSTSSSVYRLGGGEGGHVENVGRGTSLIPQRTK